MVNTEKSASMPKRNICSNIPNIFTAKYVKVGCWQSLSLIKSYTRIVFCPLCVGIFRERGSRIADVHYRDAKHPFGGNPFVASYCNGCGKDWLPYEIEGEAHMNKHSVNCPLCLDGVVVEHMYSQHNCVQGKCKPIITKDKIWSWKCDFNCKNFIELCPFKDSGCYEKGTIAELELHVRGIPNCKSDCRYNESKNFVHGVLCGNKPAICPICKREVPDRKQHWVEEHKCVEECLVASGSRTSGHNFCCEKWVGTCSICGAENTDHKHGKEAHGCTEAFVLSQSTDEEGTYISVKHREHRNNQTDGKWVD